MKISRKEEKEVQKYLKEIKIDKNEFIIEFQQIQSDLKNNELKSIVGKDSEQISYKKMTSQEFREQLDLIKVNYQKNFVKMQKENENRNMNYFDDEQNKLLCNIENENELSKKYLCVYINVDVGIKGRTRNRI